MSAYLQNDDDDNYMEFYYDFGDATTTSGPEEPNLRAKWTSESSTAEPPIHENRTSESTLVEPNLRADWTSASILAEPNLRADWTSELGPFYRDEESTTSYYEDCMRFNDTTNETHYDPSCYYLYGEDQEYYLEIYPFEIIVLGYILPTLILFTTVTNVYVIVFFMTKKNRGKAPDLLFVSIALSDTFTGLMLIPNLTEVFAKDRMSVSKEWCNAFMILRFYVSPVFHTVSVWQTVTLGIQRYLCVCHPFISGQLCTFWKTFVSIVVMYCGAIVLHTYHLTDNKIGISRCRWQTEDPCVVSCMYLWFCLILVHLLPCLMLISFTVVTLKGLRKAQKEVSAMCDKVHMQRSSSRSVRDRIISITATLIVFCFLIPELPHGIYKLVFVINKHINKHLSIEENHIIISVYEVVLVIRFHANFWIYFAMIRDFRQNLLKVLTCGAVKQGVLRLRSLSASPKCGSLTTAISRTSSNGSHRKEMSRTVSAQSTASGNIHSDIPLNPTKGYDKIKSTERYTEHAELKQTNSVANDEVFV